MGFHKNLAGSDIHEPARQSVENNTAADIGVAKGVIFSGFGTSYPQVNLADGTTDQVQGITVTAISACGGEGRICTFGLLKNIGTSAWTPTTKLFIDSSGDINISPTTSRLFAIVLDQHSATGSIWVLPYTENSAGGGAGGGSVIAWNDACANTPIEDTYFGYTIRDFQAGGSQVLYGQVKVPDGYKVGKQINLLTSLLASATGAVKLTTEVDLIRMNQDSVSSTANHYSGTNTVITVTGANIPYKIVLPLTDIDGQINGIAFSGSNGAILNIAVKSVTDSASAGIKFLTELMEVDI